MTCEQQEQQPSPSDVVDNGVAERRSCGLPKRPRSPRFGALVATAVADPKASQFTIVKPGTTSEASGSILMGVTDAMGVDSASHVAIAPSGEYSESWLRGSRTPRRPRRVRLRALQRRSGPGLAYLARSSGVMRQSVDDSTEPYFCQCSLVVATELLAVMGATLTKGGVTG